MSQAAHLKGLKPVITEMVTKIFVNNRDMRAKEVLSKVNPIILDKYDREVSLSTISKMWTELHQKDKEGSLSLPEDEPWTIMTIREKENEYQPQVLPILLKLAQLFKTMAGRQMTIREANWAVRLSSLVEHDKERGLLRLFNYAQDLAWLDRYTGLTQIRDKDEESFFQDQLYIEFTGKSLTEPVIDEAGKETPGQAIILIREGLDKIEKIGHRKVHTKISVVAREDGKVIYSKTVNNSKGISHER